jgi:hypothetical protein
MWVLHTVRVLLVANSRFRLIPTTFAPPPPSILQEAIFKTLELKLKTRSRMKRKLQGKTKKKNSKKNLYIDKYPNLDCNSMYLRSPGKAQKKAKQ